MARSRYYVNSDNSAHTIPDNDLALPPTLAPRLPPDKGLNPTTFHRALDRFNAHRNSSRAYDELTKHEQLIVREIAKTLDMEDHPCRAAS